MCRCDVSERRASGREGLAPCARAGMGCRGKCPDLPSLLETSRHRSRDRRASSAPQATGSAAPMRDQRTNRLKSVSGAYAARLGPRCPSTARAIAPWRPLPLQPVANDGEYPADHAPIIDPRLAMAPCEIARDPRYLLFVQPDQSAQSRLSLSERETEPAKSINGSKADRWRKAYGGKKFDQAKRLKDLEQEKARLKRLLADAGRDRAILTEAASGHWEGPPEDASSLSMRVVSTASRNAGGSGSHSLSQRPRVCHQCRPDMDRKDGFEDAQHRTGLTWIRPHTSLGDQPPAAEALVPADRERSSTFGSRCLGPLRRHVRAFDSTSGVGG